MRIAAPERRFSNGFHKLTKGVPYYIKGKALSVAADCDDLCVYCERVSAGLSLFKRSQKPKMSSKIKIGPP